MSTFSFLANVPSAASSASTRSMTPVSPESVTLVGELTARLRDAPYLLSIEGLDNAPGIADQRERLDASLKVLRDLTLRSSVPVGGE